MASGNAMFNSNLASCLASEGKYVQAEHLFVKAVQIEPANAENNGNLASCLYEEKKYAKAKAFFQKALAIDPTNAAYQAALKALPAGK
jgi:Tfp pilus assembly protein PilF